MSASSPPNESRGSSLIVSQWITVSIASIVVLLRIYARAILRKIAGANDWTIVIALGFALAQSILTVFQVDNGFGRHIENIQPDQIRNVLLITTIIEILHTIGTFFVRVSVCLLVLRLVPPTHRDSCKYTYLLIAFFAVVSMATFLLILLECIPIQGIWDRHITARCIPRSDLTIIAKTQGAISAVMDLLCVGLPIFYLRKLETNLERKIFLFVVLGVGLFTAACAILRAVKIDFINEDFTWHNAPVPLWSGLEQKIGIIAASLPAIHQLLTTTLLQQPHLLPNSPNSTNFPRFRAPKLHTRTHTHTSSSSSAACMNHNQGHHERGNSNMSNMSSVTTKKEPRTGYDSARLSCSPKVKQTEMLEESSYLAARWG